MLLSINIGVKGQLTHLSYSIRKNTQNLDDIDIVIYIINYYMLMETLKNFYNNFKKNVFRLKKTNNNFHWSIGLNLSVSKAGSNQISGLRLSFIVAVTTCMCWQFLSFVTTAYCSTVFWFVFLHLLFVSKSQINSRKSLNFHAVNNRNIIIIKFSMSTSMSVKITMVLTSQNALFLCLIDL